MKIFRNIKEYMNPIAPIFICGAILTSIILSFLIWKDGIITYPKGCLYLLGILTVIYLCGIVLIIPTIKEFLKYGWIIYINFIYFIGAVFIKGWS